MDNLVKEYFNIKESYFNDKQKVVEFMNDHGYDVTMEDNEFLNDFLTTFAVGAKVGYGGSLDHIERSTW